MAFIVLEGSVGSNLEKGQATHDREINQRLSYSGIVFDTTEWCGVC